MKTWKHPELGTFKYDKSRLGWAGSCALPAFNHFRWECKRNPRSIYELFFESMDEKEPSNQAAIVALRVIANQSKVALLIAPTIWDDFNGRGGNSGMWWRNDMAEVGKRFDHDRAPQGPDDLTPILGFIRITVHEADHVFPTALAELQFSAVFDEEHGVGLLTDGETILGVGYSGDTFPYYPD